MDMFDSCLNPDPPQSPEPQPTTNDFNIDVFESTIRLEKTHIEEGYADGYKDGLVLGRKDGYEVGLKHGFMSGEEIGFYRGLVDVWSSAIRVEPNCFSARIKRTIQQMRDLVEKYPFMDPENENMDEVVEGLRLKFRAVCATLGVKLEYNAYPNKSNSQEIEF